MKVHRFICFLVFLYAAAAIAGGTIPATVWVSSGKGKLKAARKAASQTISHLSVGTKLSVLDYQKKWYRVRLANGTTGWIYRGKVSKTEVSKPGEKNDGGSLGGLLGELSGSSINAENTDSSRSIRGLSPEATEYAKQKGTPAIYRKELDIVIARKVQPKEIEQFLQKGKIGEYQE